MESNNILGDQAWPKIEAQWPVIQINELRYEDPFGNLYSEIMLRAACLKDDENFQMVMLITPEMESNMDIDIIKNDFKKKFMHFLIDELM